jgi:fluoroacetyl-CoA thioesterase
MDGADMTDSEPASGAPTPEVSSVTRVTVEEKNTVGAMVPGMPYVAATPYLVGMAEMACSRLVKDLLEPGQVTVGSRVVIDHLGPSKVGAELVIKTALLQRERNRFKFSVTVEDGARTVAKVEHERAAVSLEKMMRALG